MKANLSKYSNEELYEEARKNPKSKAFELLYERFSDKIYRYCLKILQDEEKAKDVFQETFMKFFKSFRKKRNMVNVEAFIFKIARNSCLTLKNSKHNRTENIEDHYLKFDQKNYEDTEILELTKSAIDCLKLEYREPLILKEYNGLSYEQIAEVLSITSGMVKIRIYRAKKNIKKILDPYINDEISYSEVKNEK